MVKTHPVNEIRINALDGLRGFAAISIVLFHFPLQINLAGIPIFQIIFNTLAVGLNSVQIFFVLSGFFIAYKYPSVNHPAQFLQRRYKRVFPAFTILVTILFIRHLLSDTYPWFLKALIYFLILIFFYTVFLVIKKLNQIKHIGNYIFYSFLIMQIVLAVFLILSLPSLPFHSIELPSYIYNSFKYLSNLTLTYPLANNDFFLSGLFWSLVLEIVFYFIYPLAIPLIKNAKKLNILVNCLIFLFGYLILVVMDIVLSPIALIQTVHVARFIGFIIGIIIGTMYQSHSTIWTQVQKVVSNTYVAIIIVIAFLINQWSDNFFYSRGISLPKLGISEDTIKYWFYFISDGIIGLFVITALSNKILKKILSYKVLTFLGIISYSIYLTQIVTYDWIVDALKELIFYKYANGLNFNLIILILSVVVIILISYIFFRLFETFSFKQTLPEKDYSLISTSKTEFD